MRHMLSNSWLSLLLVLCGLPQSIYALIPHALLPEVSPHIELFWMPTLIGGEHPPHVWLSLSNLTVGGGYRQKLDQALFKQKCWLGAFYSRDFVSDHKINPGFFDPHQLFSPQPKCIQHNGGLEINAARWGH